MSVPTKPISVTPAHPRLNVCPPCKPILIPDTPGPRSVRVGTIDGGPVCWPWQPWPAAPCRDCFPRTHWPDSPEWASPASRDWAAASSC